MENTRKLMQLRRMLRNADIEVTLMNSTPNTIIHYRYDNIEIDLKPGQISFLDLKEVTMIPKKYWTEHWLEIVDFYTEDIQIMEQLTLEDLKLYLGATYDYPTKEFYTTVLTSDIDTVKEVLPKLNKTELKELEAYAVELYKENKLTDYKILQLLENNMPTLYFDEF